MTYAVIFKPKALKECRHFPRQDLERIFARIEAMKDDLAGDVKQLTSHTSEYRLRVGSYRVLFEIENDTIIVYRIRHRGSAYT